MKSSVSRQVATPRAPSVKKGVTGRPRLRRILVPIDFSRPSIKALRYALGLAANFDAEVRFLHVVDPENAPAPAIIRLPLVTQPETVVKMAEKLLWSWATKFGIPISARTCSVRQGKVYKKIVATASEEKADLIVLATRAHAGLKHVLHGSITERVIQHSPCPVLIVRSREREFLREHNRRQGKYVTASIKRILAPVDFSECSLTGLKYAVLLAARFRAEITLFYAINPYPEKIGGERIPGETRSLIQVVRETAQRQMDRLTRSKVLHGIRPKTKIRVSSPVEGICSEASRNDVNLIVLSTHGRTGIGHALIGSVAEHVVRCAKCPLIIVPWRPL